MSMFPFLRLFNLEHNSLERCTKKTSGWLSKTFNIPVPYLERITTEDPTASPYGT